MKNSEEVVVEVSGKSKLWTDEEIEILKEGLRSGKMVKLIAFELGRSTSAVHKYLTRSGIRQKRGPIKKPSAETQKRSDLDFALKESDYEKIYTNEKRSSFSDVLHYLENRGHKINKNRFPQKMFYKTEEYTIDKKPASKITLLLLANKFRTEEGGQVFSVPSMIF